MKINDIIKDCPALTDELIRAAYSHVVRTVRLQPLLVTIETNKLRCYDLTKEIHQLTRAELYTPLGQYALTDEDDDCFVDYDGRYIVANDMGNYGQNLTYTDYDGAWLTDGDGYVLSEKDDIDGDYLSGEDEIVLEDYDDSLFVEET